MKLSFKKILIIAGGLVLLGAAAGGGLYMGLLSGKGATTEIEEPSVADEIVSDASGEEAESHGADKAASANGKDQTEDTLSDKKGVSIKDLLYNFNRHFTANLLDPSGQVYIQVAIQIEATSPEACTELADYNGPLRDATIMLLSSKRLEDINTPSGQERLKYELQSRYDGILPEKMIKKIYFTDWMIQKQ